MTSTQAAALNAGDVVRVKSGDLGLADTGQYIRCQVAGVNAAHTWVLLRRERQPTSAERTRGHWSPWVESVQRVSAEKVQPIA